MTRLARMTLAELLDRSNPRNPKDHDVGAVIASMRRFGFVDPPIVDERTGWIVSGHGRVEALEAMRAAGEPPPPGVTSSTKSAHLRTGRPGEWSVPVVRGWESRDDQEADALLVALNRTVELGGWHPQRLAELLADLSAGAGLGGTGYDSDDLAALLAELDTDEPPGGEDPDEVPDPPADPVSKRGDVWALGPHRLACGDSTDPDDVAALLDGRRVDLMVTSPPYNVGIRYGEHDDRTTGRDAYIAFLRLVLRAWVAQLGVGRFVAWNIGVSPDTHPFAQGAALEAAGLTFYRQLAWVKVGVPLPTFHVTRERPEARRYHPNWRHEVITLWSNGAPEPGGRIVLPEVGHDDVWDFLRQMDTRDVDGADTDGRRQSLDRRSAKVHPATAKVHPATFPVQLPRTLAAYLTAPGEVVADPFAGAGTTILAAHLERRVGVGMEIDPAYVDVACRRWQRVAGEPAVHAVTGAPFPDV